MGFFGKSDEKFGATAVNNRFFNEGDTGTDNLANNHLQSLEFYHVPSGYFVLFKAFITRFSDSYRSQWKKTQVYGRMDDIATFVRTTRAISVSFQAVAANVQEAEQNMTRISLLLQMLYPSFEANKELNVSTIKGSPLFKIKFLNWIKGTSGAAKNAETGKSDSVQFWGGDARSAGLMGYLEGVSFDPNLEDGVFQAGLEIYPKVVDLSFTFNVLHEHDLGWKKRDIKGKTDFPGQPQTPRFPYGRNTEDNPKERSVGSEEFDKQKDRFKELRAAQKKIIDGG